MIELFYDKNTNTNYFTGRNQCSECNNDVIGKCIHVAMTCLHTERLAPRKFKNSLVLKTKLFCYECAVKKKKLYDVVYWTDIREVSIQTIPPQTAIPILLKPRYDVKDNKDLSGVLTTWITDNSKGIKSDVTNCETTDNTRLADRETWHGSVIGKSESLRNIECGRKDKVLSLSDVDAFLLGQKEATIELLDTHKKKLIESNGGV